jgi:integrase
MITQIGPTDILTVLRRIEQGRHFETAFRVLGWCSAIFRYGIALGLVQVDPCPGLRTALTPHKPEHFAALTKPREVGTLMTAIDEYKGSPQVRSALKFTALTFCRPGEVRRAEWEEVDFELNEWVVPKGKMKSRKDNHRVPLSRQAREILVHILPLTGKSKYIFTGRNGRPLSDNGMNTALRTMGYRHDQLTPHGFRSIASTLLNELGFRYDVIEIQLAHKGSDKIRSIYNRAEYMRERRRLMQAWADYLDALKEYAMTPGAPLPEVDVATAGL